MAEQRPVWRGHLRLALVSCPVALYSARSSRATLSFHMINPGTGNRIRTILRDAETGDEVERGDLVRGYEYRRDAYLVLDDADFDAARVESSSVLRIEKFVPAASLDPMYHDSSYFLAPEGNAGTDVYAVLREAIRDSGMIALSRVVISRRERPLALMPMGNGLVAHTLHEAADLNDPAPLFVGLDAIRIDPEMVELARRLIERQSGRFDPADFEDRYETRLREVIEARLKGKGVEPEKEPREEATNVVDLMAALRRSLGEPEAGKARRKAAPARAAAPVRKTASKRRKA